MTSPIERLPTKIMDMVVTATCANNEPRLGTADFFNLRFCSRTLVSNTDDAFAKRFFAKRKHMLSRASLQCLVEIAKSSQFSAYVKEVNIGPERINSGLDMFMARASRLQEEQFQCHAGAWLELVRQQKDFDASGQEGPMLEEAFNAFENLKHVHIYSYPDEFSDAAWRKAWGANSILRQLGSDLSTLWGSPRARYALVDQGNGIERVHGHFDRVMMVLRSIRSSITDWTLEITLNALMLRYEQRPFDLDSSSLYSRYRDRISAANINQAIQGGGGFLEESWILKLSQGCRNLRSLTIYDEFTPCIFASLTSPNLRHLAVRDSRLPYKSFYRFLANHADTLETITLSDTTMSIHMEELSFLGDDYYEDDDDDNEKGSPTWFDILSLMLDMPRLTSIRLSRLREDDDSNGRIPDHTKGEEPWRNVTGSIALSAKGDHVVKQLSRTIAASIVVVRDDGYMHEWLRRSEVWFPTMS